MSAKPHPAAAGATPALARILSRVGSPVTFKYPRNEGTARGVLKERAVIPSDSSPSGVPYWDVVDLIEFPDHPEPRWMRIGYYRKPKDRLVWGSQTTITEPLTVWRRLLVTAARQMPWFRDMLHEVLNEAEQQATKIDGAAIQPRG